MSCFIQEEEHIIRSNFANLICTQNDILFILNELLIHGRKFTNQVCTVYTITVDSRRGKLCADSVRLIHRFSDRGRLKFEFNLFAPENRIRYNLSMQTVRI